MEEVRIVKVWAGFITMPFILWLVKILWQVGPPFAAHNDPIPGIRDVRIDVQVRTCFQNLRLNEILRTQPKTFSVYSLSFFLKNGENPIQTCSFWANHEVSMIDGHVVDHKHVIRHRGRAVILCQHLWLNKKKFHFIKKRIQFKRNFEILV